MCFEKIHLEDFLLGAYFLFDEFLNKIGYLESQEPLIGSQFPVNLLTLYKHIKTKQKVSYMIFVLN